MKKLPKFEVGDKVVKRSGKKPLTVTSVTGNYVYATYDHSNVNACDYDSNFKLYEGDETTMTKDALYKIKTTVGREAYGVHIGTDSQGRYIMEEKGNAAIHVVTKDMLEEILPYTFSVRMNGQDRHFQCEEGKVKVSDILLYTAGGVDNFTFAVVKAVDTKSKTAKVWEGVRLLTQPM